ncbi:MAG: cysteine synthase CysM [Polyangiaceae bacterium]|nr:cysteine synthase CysM [Polyangiaceae bacterium]
MHVADLIGNTRLVELSALLERPGVRLFGKLEGDNPGGSVKDRPAKWMIRNAIARGELVPGMRLIEPTSGNTGIALAMLARAYGVEIDLVMPEGSTLERVHTMQAFGANVISTPAEGGMEAAIDLARQRVRDGGVLMLDQFSNPDNWLAHYETTAPEIWRDTQGQLTHFISAMGTTGTIMGCARYFAEHAPSVRVVGVHPAGESRIPGIRRWPAAYLPKIFEPARVHETFEVTAEEAEAQTRELALRLGVFVGVSAGGAVVAARRVAAGLERGTLVTILCDRGDRYLSSGLFGPRETP